MTIRAEDLEIAFANLKPPNHREGQLRFSVVPIGSGAALLGKAADGSPAFLVRSASLSAGRRPAPVVLQHIRVLFDTDCYIAQDGQAAVSSAQYTVAQCCEPDRVLQDYFLGSLPSLIGMLPGQASSDEIRTVITSFAELFRAFGQPSRKSISGLWAELFMITLASSPSVLVEHWHTQHDESFDFAAGADRLEVKATSTGKREHHFSLNQLHGPSGTRTLVASVFVERAAGGVSIGQLIAGLRTVVAERTELLVRLELLVAAALGSDWRNGLTDTFDAQRAHDSLRFVDSRSIPSIDPAVPSEVSEVRFKADLTRSQAIPVSEMRSLGGLFAAAAPTP